MNMFVTVRSLDKKVFFLRKVNFSWLATRCPLLPARYLPFLPRSRADRATRRLPPLVWSSRSNFSHRDGREIEKPKVAELSLSAMTGQGRRQAHAPSSPRQSNAISPAPGSARGSCCMRHVAPCVVRVTGKVSLKSQNADIGGEQTNFGPGRAPGPAMSACGGLKFEDRSYFSDEMEVSLDAASTPKE